MPPTAYSTPSTLPSVLGSTSSRSVASAACDSASVPEPASVIETVATVLSRLASTSIGPFIWPVASASCFRATIAS